MRTLLVTLSLLTLLPVQAQSAKPVPVKVITRTCGAYTLQVRENEDRTSDRVSTISVVRGGKTLATVKDEMVGVNACQDITGDGVPEALLYGFSGGAHCCFTQYVYNLTTPPRLLLEYDAQHSEALEPRQLNGQGPKELLGDDWRFAYAYGLSFAESVPLPTILGYRGGRYVEVSREFPGVLRSALITKYDEGAGGEYLANYALLTVAGRPGEAREFLRRAPQPYRDWLGNYAPDIRQEMLSYGLEDWPTRAGAPLNTASQGIGGSFARPSQHNLLAVTREGKSAVLRLYTQAGSRIVRTAPLLTAPWPPLDPSNRDAYPLDGLTLVPLATVWRSGLRQDDALIANTPQKRTTITAYRLSGGRLILLRNDALSAAAGLLGDLSNVASSVAAQYTEGLTPAQKTQRQQQARAAVQAATPWLRKTNLPLPLGRLGDFEFGAAELTSDQPKRAQLQVPVSYGLAAKDQQDEYVSGERYTLTIDLAKQAGQWVVANWTLAKRAGELNR